MSVGTTLKAVDLMPSHLDRVFDSSVQALRRDTGCSKNGYVMQISAEIRWFWRAAPPTGLEAWFREPREACFACGGGQLRLDEYLSDPGQTEMGVKRRGGKKGVEVKGRVVQIERTLEVAPFVGPVEIWAKWSSEALEVPCDRTVKTIKRRWLRKFDTAGPFPVEVALTEKELPVDSHRPLPVRGCNVEVTEVTVTPGGNWWTLGFEAFGSMATIGNDLRRVTEALADTRPPDLTGGLIASYPLWLKEHLTAGSAGIRS